MKTVSTLLKCQHIFPKDRCKISKKSKSYRKKYGRIPPPPPPQPQLMFLYLHCSNTDCPIPLSILSHNSTKQMFGCLRNIRHCNIPGDQQKLEKNPTPPTPCFPKTRRAYFIPNTDVNNIYLEKSKQYLLRPELRYKYLISYSVLSCQIPLVKIICIQNTGICCWDEAKV